MLRWLAGALVMAWLVGATPARAQNQPPPSQPVPTPKPVPPPARKIVLPPSTFNIALLGVDTRPGRGMMNTDVIIIASVNPDVPIVTLLSIPRDTPVYIPGVGVHKVNQAYAIGGPDLFKETIRYNFGLDIANYAMVNFTGLVRAVDALGGVDVIATCPIQHSFPRDPYYMGGSIVARDYVDTFTGEVWPAGSRVPLLRLDLPKPGVYRLNGLQALAYVRARYNIPGGDLDRGRREQRLVRALLAKARQVGSLTKLTQLYDAVRDHVETDLTLESILRYALMADKIGDAVVRSRYLVGYDAAGAALEGAPTRSSSRLEYIQKALSVALNQRINDGIPIEVLDGVGDPGFVLAAADRLKELGFVVTAIKPAGQPYAHTIVIDHTTTQKGSALPLLLRTFGIKQRNVVPQPNSDGPRFTVIVGADFNPCYYAKSLSAAGSQPVKPQEPPLEATLPSLETSVVVTDTAHIEQAVAESLNQTAVVVTATALLESAASAAAPLASPEVLRPTFSVPLGDVVNVRSAPTLRSRTLGRLRGGFTSEILGRSVDGNWLQFQMPRSGRLAWVNKNVVHIEGYFQEVAVKDESQLPPDPDVPRIVVPAGSVVNVRGGPGLSFKVIGRMRARQSAPIIGRSNDGAWWQIEFAGQPAWIAARYVRVTGNVGTVPKAG
ncbi:MAG: LCP family protein [Anaerolineae bacterium]|nr:LCP family protein [Anaerolineae bacterium]